MTQRLTLNRRPPDTRFNWAGAPMSWVVSPFSLLCGNHWTSPNALNKNGRKLRAESQILNVFVCLYCPYDAFADWEMSFYNMYCHISKHSLDSFGWQLKSNISTTHSKFEVLPFTTYVLISICFVFLLIMSLLSRRLKWLHATKYWITNILNTFYKECVQRNVWYGIRHWLET